VMERARPRLPKRYADARWLDAPWRVPRQLGPSVDEPAADSAQGSARDRPIQLPLRIHATGHVSVYRSPPDLRSSCHAHPRPWPTTHPRQRSRARHYGDFPRVLHKRLQIIRTTTMTTIRTALRFIKHQDGTLDGSTASHCGTHLGHAHAATAAIPAAPLFATRRRAADETTISGRPDAYRLGPGGAGPGAAPGVQSDFGRAVKESVDGQCTPSRSSQGRR